MHKQINISLLLMLAVFCGSCSNSTSTGGGTPNGSGSGGMGASGSAYHYEKVTTDSTGTLISTTHYTDSVVATGLVFMGQSNVTKFVSINDTGITGTGYFAASASGDPEAYFPGEIPVGSGIKPQWIIYPVVSGGSNTYTIVDTTISSKGVQIEILQTMQLTHGSASSMVVQGTTLQVQEVQTTVTSSTTINGVNQTASSVTGTSYFATSLGMTAKSVTNESALNRKITTILTSYTVK